MGQSITRGGLNEGGALKTEMRPIQGSHRQPAKSSRNLFSLHPKTRNKGNTNIHHIPVPPQGTTTIQRPGWTGANHLGAGVNPGLANISGPAAMAPGRGGARRGQALGLGGPFELGTGLSATGGFLVVRADGRSGTFGGFEWSPSRTG